MTNLLQWWQHLPKRQKPLWIVLSYTLILTAGIDLGRTLYHLFHAVP
jgi:hypothetical protein